MCEAKNIQVNFNAPEIYKTENDKNGVAVVVRNLLNNAIKFSQPNSSIGVGLTKEASGKFSITVSDTGTGMSAHQIEQYHQGTLQSTQGTRSETGTGLGFLIIKDYCKKMNAEIIISSTLGKGSEFVFKF